MAHRLLPFLLLILSCVASGQNVRFIWPTEGKVTSTFDPARKGIDITGKPGQPVVAVSDGKVLYAKNMRGYGNLIIIEHSDSMVTAYAHNQTILVREGQAVIQGQQIAEMGNSDSATVKLQFQMRHMGTPIDPANLLQPYYVTEQKAGTEPDSSTPNGLTVDDNEQTVLEKGIALFKANNFQAAAQIFSDFLKQYPGSEHEAKVNYFLGGSYFAAGDCKNAALFFQIVFTRYPFDTRAPDSLLNIATCQDELNDKKAARGTMESLVKLYPQSPAAKLARERLAPPLSDMDRERQQLAEERHQLEEEKRRQQAENRKESNTNKKTTAIDSRRRVALVIGNATYKNSPLRNPTNDADLISNALSGSGFIVSRYDNLTYAKMREVVRTFGEKLSQGDVGLFYFSGHAVQYRGKNYLLPINEDLKHSDEIPSSAMDIDFVLAKMETAKNDLNIVILDSCRNNPLGTEARNLDRGLTTINAAKGTFIAFATSPGNIAFDGTGSNSPYTKNLAQAIRKGGLTLEQVFKEVRRNVISETNSQQVPWENSSILGDFYFR